MIASLRAAQPFAMKDSEKNVLPLLLTPQKLQAQHHLQVSLKKKICCF